MSQKNLNLEHAQYELSRMSARFLPLSDLSRKIEGDSVRRVPYQKSEKIPQTLLLFHDMVIIGPFNPFAPGDFAEKRVLKLVE